MHNTDYNTGVRAAVPEAVPVLSIRRSAMCSLFLCVASSAAPCKSIGLLYW